MLTELTNVVQSWLAFSLVLGVQIGLVLLLRKPVRAWLGAVACYRSWLLPLLWLPFYVLGPRLLAALANLGAATQQSSQYQIAVQQFIKFELLPFNVGATGNPELAATGYAASYGWTVLALLWLAGTLALIAWQGRRWLVFSRQVSQDALPLSSLEREQSGAAAHFGARIPVRSLREVSSAALFGVFRPVLLLPESFCQRYDGNQRHIILAHEAVHLRRGDNGWNLCALLLMALFWTNPLVLLAWRYYRLDQELSCDALALAQCNKQQQKCYARTLLDSLASLSPYTTQPALSAWDNLRDIKERSLMVKQHLHTATRPVATLFSLLALAVLGASLTITFAELVSPGAQAAEPAPRTQVAQQEIQAPRPVTQAPQQATQEDESLAEEARQVAQEAQPAAQEPRPVTQVPEQVGQEAQQQTQEAEPVTQEAQPVTRVRRQLAQVPSSATRTRRGPEEDRVSTDIDAQTGRILSDAIEFLNMDQFAEARERLADLRLDRLSPFEKSRYEQLMFSLDLNDENYPGARAHLQAAIDSGGLNPQEESTVRYQMAQLYLQEEKYAEAATALEAWIAAEPMPSSGAYYLLAACYYSMEQFDAALAPAEKAVELARASGNTPRETHLSMLLMLYISLEQFAAAESVRVELEKLFPDKEAYRKRLPLEPQVRINPDYPRRALARGIEGWVQVQFTISETGSVIDPVVVNSDPKNIFDDAAINAVTRSRYNPKMEGAVAVPRVGVQTTVRFALN